MSGIRLGYCGLNYFGTEQGGLFCTGDEPLGSAKCERCLGGQEFVIFEIFAHFD